jgi:hypothetical protein
MHSFSAPEVPASYSIGTHQYIFFFFFFLHGLGRLTCYAIFSWGVHDLHVIRRYPRLRAFADEYFIFLGRVTSPSANPQFLEDQFIFLSLASLLRPVRLGRPYQEHKVPAGMALRSLRLASPAPRQGGEFRGSSSMHVAEYRCVPNFISSSYFLYF